MSDVEIELRERQVNYPGRTSTQVGDLMGPGLDDRFWEVTEVVYDPEADKTSAYLLEQTRAEYFTKSMGQL